MRAARVPVRAFRWKTWLFQRFRRMTFCKPRTHQFPATQFPLKIDERFYRPVIAKFRYSITIRTGKRSRLFRVDPGRQITMMQNSENQIEALSGLNQVGSATLKNEVRLFLAALDQIAHVGSATPFSMNRTIDDYIYRKAPLSTSVCRSTV